MICRKGQQRSDRLPIIRNVWIEEKALMPRGLVSLYETNINNLLDLFLGKGTSMLLGLERNATQPVTIVNKLSGKALEVEDSSTDQGARIRQVTRNNGAANQRWFVKRMKFIAQRIIPRVVDRKVLPWPTVLRFSHAVYSVIADHSGLCLDILNGSTDNSAAVQQLPANGGNNQLWAFVPDRKGFNFIVNVHSGQVLDVADKSLKNYAQVRHYPFTGADSQRWQLTN